MLKNYEISLGFPRVILEYFTILGLLTVTIIQLYLGKSLSEILLLLVVFGVAAFKLIPSFNKILICLNSIQYNLPSLELIYSILINKQRNINFNTIEKKNIDLTKNLFFKKLEFKEVIFKYKNSNKLILNKVNFEIKPKDVFGILGESGAGKSTIIDLIIGLLKPTDGKILLDGKDLNLVKDSWQKLIGYVPQNIYLNDESIKENISFNRETSDQEISKVINALKKARIYEFVKSLPDGLDTKVGERGIKLSGGQKQRIGIARALYGDPKILVLDEATNQLDKENEMAILDTINNIEDVTVIIISHNKSALVNCNKIINIKAGELFAMTVKKRILIPINSDLYIRNYIRTGVLNKLKKNFDLFFIANKDLKNLEELDKLENFKGYFQYSHAEETRHRRILNTLMWRYRNSSKSFIYRLKWFSQILVIKNKKLIHLNIHV